MKSEEADLRLREELGRDLPLVPRAWYAPSRELRGSVASLTAKVRISGNKDGGGAVGLSRS